MRTINGIATVLLFVCFAGYAQETEKTVLASDKKTQISVPSTWAALELNEAAEIQLGSEKDEAYLIVLNELKDDMYGWNLEKHSRVTLGSLLAKVSFPVVIGPKALTIGGRPAIQYEVRGASNNRNVIYIHTTVDGEKYFSQILAWTLPSHADAVRPQLLKASATFREVAD
jgi:hypothetical protein